MLRLISVFPCVLAPPVPRRRVSSGPEKKGRSPRTTLNPFILSGRLVWCGKAHNPSDTVKRVMDLRLKGELCSPLRGGGGQKTNHDVNQQGLDSGVRVS